MDFKKCSIKTGCGKDKPISEFYFGKRGYFTVCKNCKSIQKKQEYQKNKEKIVERVKNNSKKEDVKLKNQARSRIYILKNKTKKAEYDKEYRENNKEKLINYSNNLNVKNKKRKNANQRYHNSYKNDPMVKIRNSVSSNIRKFIIKNNDSCLNYLPYSMQELKEHLERQFEPWMNWNNYGKYNKLTHDQNPKWNIDHIIPHSTFNYDGMEHPDFQKCWALSNLRPLDAKQNQLDGVSKIRHKNK